MKKNILFIINPVSGGKSKKKFPELARKFLDPSLLEPEYVFTKHPDHAYELALNAVKAGVDIVAAVGGDGTINEVASAIESTSCIMGIIPFGSGNGLARSLNISLNNEHALRAINSLNTRTIDTGILNEWKFFNIGGIGFDAHISSKFAGMKSRGFKGYIKTTFTEIIKYKPQRYRIEIDGRELERKAFMISIANSSQYGNNAHISPHASLDDGLLDLCVVKPFPLLRLPLMGYHMFAKSSHKSGYVEIIKGKNIRIQTDKSSIVHVDGEPRELSRDILISVKPLSLSVLY